MTFKHINFDDSPVMRSLERMAISKEQEKQSIIEKTASENNKPDFTPTEDFFSNLTKLCSGLRDVGLSKYADELENNYLRYKQAQTEYSTSKETGEDLVDQAHPKGSVQVSDGEYGIVETIVDQQLKTLKILDKKPTGKLTNAFDIINAVKLSIGQVSDDMENLRRKAAINQVQKINPLLNSIETIINRYFGNSTTYKSRISTNISQVRVGLGKITEDGDIRSGIKEVIGDLEDMVNSTEFFDWKDLGLLNPVTAPFSAARHVGDITDLFTGDYLSDKRDEILSKINSCLSIANTALGLYMGQFDDNIKKYYGSPEKEERKPGSPITLEEVSITSSEGEIQLGKVNSYIGNALSKLRVLTPVINSSGDVNSQKAISQISSIISKLTEIKNQSNAISPDLMTEQVANKFIGIASPYVRKTNALYNAWMK